MNYEKEKIKAWIGYCRNVAAWLVDSIDSFPTWTKATEAKNANEGSGPEGDREEQREHIIDHPAVEVE